jgi:hypothetical protein
LNSARGDILLLKMTGACVDAMKCASYLAETQR